jgi:hypothetical protein
MSIVGDKEVFAIEWEITAYYAAEQWTSVHCRFWCNSVSIGEWNDFSKFEGILCTISNFLKFDVERPEWDFSAYGKDDIFYCFDNLLYHYEIDERFFDFFASCRSFMLNQYTATDNIIKETSCGKHRKFKQAKYLREFPVVSGRDSLLVGWISRRYAVNRLGSEDIDNHWTMYLVQDISLNRERLIWKYNIENEIHETILPKGYFVEIIYQFLEAGNSDRDNFCVSQ